MLQAFLTLVFLLQFCLSVRANVFSLADPFHMGMATRRGRRLEMEDRVGAWAFRCFEDGKQGRTYGVWAVFDGHNSAAVSSYLEAALHIHLRRRLCEVDPKPQVTDSAEAATLCRRGVCHVRKALVLAFQDLDADLQQQQQQPTQPESLAGDCVQGLPSSKLPTDHSTVSCSTLSHTTSPGTARAGALSPEVNATAADGLGILRSAAAAAAWDAGSTAVVAVAAWDDLRATVCCSAGSGAVMPGAASPAETMHVADDDGGKTPRPHAGNSAAATDGSNTDVAGAQGGYGWLWLASLGNSPAILCVPAAPQVAGGASSTGDAVGENDGSVAGAGGVAKERRMKAAGVLDRTARTRRNGGGGDSRLLVARVLTANHDLQNVEEVRRVMAAGGRVDQPSKPGGTPRLMGDLEVSRAFGDLQYRQYGLSTEPDITGPWRLDDAMDECSPAASSNNSNGTDGWTDTGTGPKQNGVADGVGGGEWGSLFVQCRVGGNGSAVQLAPHLLLASDGILETMSPQDMCEHLAAQLTGAREPLLTPAPPPAIALGPTNSKVRPLDIRSPQDPSDGDSSQAGAGQDADMATRGTRFSEPASRSDAAGVGYRTAGLPGCCDCDLKTTSAQASKLVDDDMLEDACAAQALRRPFYLRPDRRTVQDAATRLVQEAFNRGSMDNVATVVVRLPRHAPQPDQGKLGNAASAGSSLPTTSAAARTMPNPLDTAAPPLSIMPAATASAASHFRSADQPGPMCAVGLGNSLGSAEGLAALDPTCAGADAESASGPGHCHQVAAWMPHEAVPSTAETATARALSTTMAPTERLWVAFQQRCRAIPARRPPVTPQGPHSFLPAAAETGTPKSSVTAAGWDVLRAFHDAWFSHRRWLLGRLRALLGYALRSDGASRQSPQRKLSDSAVSGEVPAPYYTGQVGDASGDAGAVIALMCPQQRRGSVPDTPVALGSGSFGGAVAVASAATVSPVSTAISEVCEVPGTRQGINHGTTAGPWDEVPDDVVAVGEDWVQDAEELVQVSYGYVLAERIGAVPSVRSHLHVSSHPGGEALQPWRLSDFDGAATFIMPGLGGTGWLLDRLQMYCSRPYDAPGVGTAIVPDVGVRLPGGDREASIDGGGTDGSSSSSSSHALMSFSSTQSLLLEIAAVPLHLALFSNNVEDPAQVSADASGGIGGGGGGCSRPDPIAPTTYTIGGRPGTMQYDDVAPARNSVPGLSNAGAAPLLGPDADSSFADGRKVSFGAATAAIAWDQRPTQWTMPPRDRTEPGDLPHDMDLAADFMEETPQLSLSPLDPWVGPVSSLGISGRNGRALLRSAVGGAAPHGLLDGHGGDAGVAGGGGGSGSLSIGDGVQVDLPVALVTSTAATPAADHRAVVAHEAPQLRFQPRAHGVRLADGALHLVTDEPAATVAASTTAVASGADGRSAGGSNSDGSGGDALGYAYRLRERFGQGHFGEVWRAWRLDRFPIRDAAQDAATIAAAAAGLRPGGASGRPSGQGEATGPAAAAAAAAKATAAAAAAVAARGPPGFVLKRLRGSSGKDVLLSGLREAYFGDRLRRRRGAATVDAPREESVGGWRSDRGYGHLVEFLESFEVVPEDADAAADVPLDPGSAAAKCTGGDSVPAADCGKYGNGGGGGGDAGSTDQTPPPPDLWLVFQNAGRSLHDLIYSPVGLHTVQQDDDEEEPEAVDEEAGEDVDGRRQQQQQQQQQQADGPAFQVLGPSPWWQAMRRHPRGNEFIRQLLRQLLLGLQVVHEANATHRDVKPENMMLTHLTHGSSRPPRAARPHAGTAAAAGGGDASASASAASAASAAGAPPSYDTIHDDPTTHRRRRPAENQAGHGTERRRAPSSPGRQWLGAATLEDQSWSKDEGEQSDGASEGSAKFAGPADDSGDSDGGEDEAVAPVWLRLIDFGSAVDDYSLQHLYGSKGPTSDQLTLEYAPPEALFGRYWDGMKAMRPRAWAYDIWSVGVVWLELLMATPQVWQLPSATRALLEARLALRSRPESERQLVFLLRGLMEWCIYPPQAPSTPSAPPLRGRKSRPLMSWSCTDEALLALAKSRDPLGLGLEGPMALRLLLRLLHWDPASRPSARQALRHAYFTLKPSAWALHVCGEVALGDSGWC